MNRHTDRTYADVKLLVFLVCPFLSLLKISALPPVAFRDKGSMTFFQLHYCLVPLSQRTFLDNIKQGTLSSDSVAILKLCNELQ